jgi:hypothetical protein
MVAQRNGFPNLKTGISETLLPLTGGSKSSVAGHPGGQPQIDVKPDGKDAVPETIYAVFRDQKPAAVAENAVCFIQEWLVVCRMVKNV